MDFSVYGILQARILEWVAILFSRRSSQPRDWTQVSCIVGRRFTFWATREVKYFFEPPFFCRGQTYKLNKQGDNVQLSHAPFPILNQSTVPCPVLTVASWPAWRFLNRQARWSGIPVSWRSFHNLLWFTQSKTLGSQWNRSRCFSGTHLLFLRFNGCWQLFWLVWVFCVSCCCCC